MEKSLSLKPKNIEENDDLRLNFEFSPNLVDHLGLKMYDSPIRSIAELIANSWDADAENVFVELPTDQISDQSIIAIRDDGIGMKKEEIKTKFLNIGLNRREESEVSPKKRELMGKKGIGKFAGFGIADILEIHTVHESENKIFSFKIDLKEMHKYKSLIDYEIEILIDDEIEKLRDEKLEVITNKKSGKIQGTTMILKHLRDVHRCPNVETFKTGITKRFRTGPDFQIFVNEEPVSDVKIENRRELIIDEDIEEEIELDNGEKKTVNPGHINGVIALSDKPLHYEPGILIYTRGRSVETTKFNLSRGYTGQIYTAYLHGEIQAEWLDTSEKDLIRTDRGGIRWETDEGKAFEIWGQKKIKEICSEEADRIKEEKLKWEERPEFRNRYLKLTPPYRKESKRIIETVIQKMVGTETEEFIDPMINLLLLAFENRDVFLIIKALNESDVKDLKKFSIVLQDWSIVELTHMVQVVEARLELIDKLEEYIKNPATLEFPTMQKFLEEYPWLLNPMYDVLAANRGLSETLNKMALEYLKKKCGGKLTEEELRKKPDFICMGALGKYIIIEIKRPMEKVGVEEIRQLEDYWLYVCKELDMTSPEVTGLFIAHDFNEDAKRIVTDHRALSALKYNDLWRQAHNLHKDFLDVLRKRREKAEQQSVEKTL